MSTSSEPAPSAGEVLDVSTTGVLIRFEEVMGVRVTEQVSVTIVTTTGRLHRLGQAVRVTPRAGAGSCVAIDFAEVDDGVLAVLVATSR